MSRQVVFLDRDGTLNMDTGYTYQTHDYQLLPGVKEGLKRLAEAGYALFVLTNQSGIGRGIYTHDDCRKFNNWLEKDLAEGGIVIEGFYHCPHHCAEGIGKFKVECDCRKPKPGLVFQAEREGGPFDFQNSWAIGDKPRDLEAAKRANEKIRTILVPKNFGTSTEEHLSSTKYADYSVADFLKAVDIILCL